MESYFNKDTEFLVIPADFDNAVCMHMETFDNDILTLECKDNINFNEGEQVEVFAGIKNGIMYFKSDVIVSKNAFLQIKVPDEYEILQRRENERIIINEDVLIFDEKEQIKAKLMDLSVGGMKVLSENELKINGVYNVSFKFDDLDLLFKFTPLRISADGDKYCISGVINSEKSSDKIELVQYCYKKQFESSNRK